MLIQSSELTARPGHSGTLGPTVMKMRDVLSEATSSPWHAWVAFGGRPYGTYMLSTRYANHAAMIGSIMQIGASAPWAELSATVDGIMEAPAPSRLAEVIAVAGTPTEPKQFTSATVATMSGTDLARAMAWSVEVGEHVATITGHSVTIGTNAAGTMFQIGWISGADTPEELDAAFTAINADGPYLEMLAEAGTSGLFIPGSTDRVLLAKMP